jgi:hypothetical protein
MIDGGAESRLSKAKGLHSGVLQRRETNRWNVKDGAYGTLSYEKLIQKMHLSHPRIFVKEPGSNIPVAKQVDLCHPIGDLSDAIFYGKEEDKKENLGDEEPTPGTCDCFYTPEEIGSDEEIERLQTKVFD